jgi:BTB/POZ domain-containing protein KCTD9
MSPQPGARLSYEDSCRVLQRLGDLEDGPIPPMPARRPRHDDGGPLGVSFFRTIVRGMDLEGLTLPRRFFGRSEIGPMSFRNTDPSESTLCWNDFIEVDFTDCDLSDSDLRASGFVGVKFVRAVLRNADLRRSHFEDCDFTDADLDGARLTYDQRASLSLSDEQRRVIDWRFQAGEEPEGG